MDIKIDDDYPKYYFRVAVENNKIPIIKYFIEETNVEILFVFEVSFDIYFKIFSSLTKNYERIRRIYYGDC